MLKPLHIFPPKFIRPRFSRNRNRVKFWLKHSGRNISTPTPTPVPPTLGLSWLPKTRATENPTVQKRPNFGPGLNLALFFQKLMIETGRNNFNSVLELWSFFKIMKKFEIREKKYIFMERAQQHYLNKLKALLTDGLKSVRHSEAVSVSTFSQEIRCCSTSGTMQNKFIQRLWFMRLKSHSEVTVLLGCACHHRIPFLDLIAKTRP